MSVPARPDSAPLEPLAGLRVFVSYPRGGLAHTWAERVAGNLRERGAEPFLDQDQIREGEAHWLQRLVDGLARADVLVCIVGADSEACRWQQRELIQADALRLPVVPLRVAVVPMPFAINERQPVELGRAEPAEALARLAAAVAAAAPAARPALAQQAIAGSTAAQAAASAVARTAEVAWLEELIHGALSTH